MELVIGNNRFHTPKENIPIGQLQQAIFHDFGLAPDQFYLISNGRRVTTEGVTGTVHIVPRTLGGKGGFGSMLRAIGAQIEKTTNREACRDLSGRRIRDINEEQRLKKWVAQQAEREKEAKEKKKKKLEKLLEQPKHEFKDEEYDKERSALPDKVEDAVLKGLEASCLSAKRKSDDIKSDIPKKKAKLWIDDELDEDLSSSGSDSEDDIELKPSTSSSLSLKIRETSSTDTGTAPTDTEKAQSSTTLRENEEESTITEKSEETKSK